MYHYFQKHTMSAKTPLHTRQALLVLILEKASFLYQAMQHGLSFSSPLS